MKPGDKLQKKDTHEVYTFVSQFDDKQVIVHDKNGETCLFRNDWLMIDHERNFINNITRQIKSLWQMLAIICVGWIPI